MEPDEILNWLGQLVIYGGGSVAIAYGAFRFFGEKWIENKFALNLEQYRSVQAQELEKIKSEIGLHASRTLKLHDKQYEILPEAWTKLNIAYNAIQKTVMSFRQFPDFSKMTFEDVDEFFEEYFKKTKALKKVKRNTLKNASNKNNAFVSILEWRDLDVAFDSFQNFQEFLEKNRIFLDENIKEKFDSIQNLLWKAIVAFKVGKEHRTSSNDPYLESHKHMGSVKPIKDELENLVREKLFRGQ